MRLATPDTVLTLLGIQNSSGSLAAAGAALDATYPVIESYLDTTLLVARRTDYFDLTKYDSVGPVLRLSCSFVSKVETMTLEYSNDGRPLNAGNRSAIPADVYHVDYDYGVVYLYSTFAPTRRSIAVTYTAGFEPDMGNAELLADIPESLRQGGISKAAAYMLLNPANVAKDKARFIAETAVHGVDLKANQALQRFLRPRGNCIWHDHTEIVE